MTNCPLVTTLLAVELFGARGCCISRWLLSELYAWYQGLYSSQTILYPN